jgi:serine/threonine protein kinase
MMTNSNDNRTTSFFDHYIGNYRLLRLLGQGAFASVYLGEHRYLKRLAAVKVLRTVLNNRDKERFLEEARLLANLSHAHIVRVFEFAVAQRVSHARGRKFTEYIPYLIMDFAPGGSLRALYPAGSCLSIDVVVGYIKQIATALQYAHDNGVIHRDVKPENCLFDEQQEIMLSDFGLALFAPTPNLLSTQQMEGTLPYAAPEQLRGKPGFASDQYSLAVIAYEWLCGHRPFEGEEVEIIMQHISSPPPRLRSKNLAISQAVEEVILKALEKDPQQRYPSVLAFARALEHANQRSPYDGSPYDHAAKIFPPDSGQKDRLAWSFSPKLEVKPVYVRETNRRHAGEKIYAPPVKQRQATRLRKDRRQLQWSHSSSPWWRKKRIPLIIGIMAFILILGSSGTFSLKSAISPSVPPVKARPTVIQIPATALSPPLATADFTVKPPTIHGMTQVADDTAFEGDHAALGAGQQIVVDFFLPNSPGSEKPKPVSIIITALVARSGNNHGYAPMDIYCNGHALVQNFTIPGEGFQSNETSIQIPPGLLVQGKNEIKLLIISAALSEFWLYRMGISMALPSTASVANFTVNPTSVHGMTLETNETAFGEDHAALDIGRQVVADFFFPDSPMSGKSMPMSIIITALVARLGNNHGYAPITLYCNGHALVQDFTIPGEGFQPNEISFQIPPGLLVQGKNEMKLLVSTRSHSILWLYSIGIRQGTLY